jgi:predicted transcriptional regulator
LLNNHVGLIAAQGVNILWGFMAFSEMIGIIRFCETPKDKGRIMSRLGLNDVLAESYLAILIRQSMLMHNDGKYVVTDKGQSYVSSSERVKKIKA